MQVVFAKNIDTRYYDHLNRVFLANAVFISEAYEESDANFWLNYLVKRNEKTSRRITILNEYSVDFTVVLHKSIYTENFGGETEAQRLIEIYAYIYLNDVGRALYALA